MGSAVIIHCDCCDTFTFIESETIPLGNVLGETKQFIQPSVASGEQHCVICIINNVKVHPRIRLLVTNKEMLC